MPEYLAPGVYVEESSAAAATIEGVDTSIAAFLGPCRYGPVGGVPSLLTSYAEFERLYGGLDALDHTPVNYLAQATRAFFEEGGQRLYAVRLYSPVADSDGVARWTLPTGVSSPTSIELKARYPGAAGSVPVTLVFKRERSKLRVNSRGKVKLKGVKKSDVVWAQTRAQAASEPPAPGQFYRVQKHRRGLRLGNANTRKLKKARAFEAVYAVSVSVTVAPLGQGMSPEVWPSLVFEPARPNSLSRVFAVHPDGNSKVHKTSLVFEFNGARGDEIANALAQLGNDDDGSAIIECLDSEPDAARSVTLQLGGGNDGEAPLLADYAGSANVDSAPRGLLSLETLDDVAMVATPGASALGAAEADLIRQALIAFCERQRFPLAVLDAPPGATPNAVLEVRRGIDSSRAALYYPWVQIRDPLTGSSLFNPPSGHICGIYARNDLERGVHKAPANEVIRLAIGFDVMIDTAEQELLNPEGINCLRFFSGRGHRVWGARTASSDPQWRYLNLRRYLSYLERSIDRGTQWVVFEPNGQPLWERLRIQVENFLLQQWRSGRFQGSKPADAVFVRCDRSTMTQNDLDNGRVVCEVGVAMLRPAEFVIFRIGQKTLDANS